MGLTLIAILTAALLLPGIIAARSFYQAGQTNEVEPSVPALSSTDGIALVGIFSVVVHLVYAIGLTIALAIPAPAVLQGFPLANPYVPFGLGSGPMDPLALALSLFLGLTLLCLVAMIVGNGMGRLFMRQPDKSIFYGPMAEIFAATGSDEDFVVAYVLTKMEHDARVIGYQGTVVSLLRDDDRFPAKVVLKNVSVFYLTFQDDRPVRHETVETIDWIALSAGEWHNIAFKIFRVVEDTVPAKCADAEAIT